MYEGKTVGVVVPAYNEEGFVGDVIDTIPEFVDRVYVVDDGSTDGTWNEITAHAARANRQADATRTDGGNVDHLHSAATTARTNGETSGGTEFDRWVVPIQHDENRGVGNSIKTGYLRALDDEIDVTAVMGGDGQMDPDILDRIIDPVVEGEADYAKGNRLLYEDYREGMSRWRFFGNSILTFLTKIASGYWKMMDPQNGYTAISKRALETVGIERMYGYYGYCNDLLVRLNANGMRVADVAMPAVYADEESSITYRVYIRKVSGMLLRDFCWRLKVKYLVLDFHPLALFYVFGASMSGLGTLSGGWAVYDALANGTSFFVQTSISLLIFLVGSLFLLFAMLFDMQANQDMEIQRYE